jgi:hypothetical protein
MKLRFGIVAGIFLAIFCLYPQFKMLYLRGDAWNGHYAYNDIDEVAYASYVRALIDGRPRKNDPYSGNDDSRDSPQPESLFSIQFAAPYSIAVPARLLGIGTPWAMTLSGAVAGFLAAFAAFWLIARFTGNYWFGMAGSLAVFAGGAVFAGEGAMLEVFFEGFSYPYFPGFRRYIPAMAMPAIFAFFGLVWVLLFGRGDGAADEHLQRRSTDTDASIPGNKIAPAAPGGDLRVSTRWSYLVMLAAVFCFAFCVFSYFYIWTTAAAWMGMLALLWAVVQPERYRKDLKKIGLVGAGCAAALLPYAYLLSHRSQTMDDVQLLVYTRAPDLWRMPEYISVVCLGLMIAGFAARLIGFRERSTLFTLSVVLVPLTVFNQQIITGRSLQPIHYQVFIGNYVAGLGLVLTAGLLLRKQLLAGGKLVRAACLLLSAAGVIWGFVECHYTVRVLDEANAQRDDAFPVAKRLEELALSDTDPHRSTVLAYDMIQADDLPSVAPQNVLWARHQHVFSGLTWQENKERYYLYLYYFGVDEAGLDYLLKNDFVSQIALFGWGRHTDRLSFNARPLTYGEIAHEVQNYAVFRATFNASSARSPLLSYVVVNEALKTDLTNVDKWYERYEGERIGNYTIYRVRPRAAVSAELPRVRAGAPDNLQAQK